MATIGLCMMVRNEAAIIERCLRAALSLIDYACIVDAGSDDDTVAVATRLLQRHSVAHDIYREIPMDFASCRNGALKRLRRNTGIDYCLVLDPGDVVRYEGGFDPRQFKKHLQHDVYDVRLQAGSMEYFRPIMFENSLECYYRGKLHGFMVVPSHATRGDITGFCLETTQINHNPEKCLHEAREIEQAMADEADPFMLSRYCFYLGQSFMEGGDLRRAIKAFYGCVGHRGEGQKIFISLLRIARLMERLDYREERVAHAYLRAWSACPQRAEPLCDLAAYSRRRGQWSWARLFSASGLHLEKPVRGLFVETDVYAYRLLDEYALASYVCGHYQESLDAWTRLLKSPLLPASERERIVGNAQSAFTHL